MWKRIQYMAVAITFFLMLPFSVSAAILNFENPNNLGVTIGGEMLWNGTGGGHLFMQSHWGDDFIYFGQPTYVNSFRMNHLPFEGGSAGVGGDAVNVFAFDINNSLLWQKTIDLFPYDWINGWIPINVNVGNVSSLMFNTQFRMWPSIDDLRINESNPVPIPASLWLLCSGLIGLAGIRKKIQG